MTPYTEDGRRRYVNYRTKHKPLPCDRPSINTPEDIALSIYASGKGYAAPAQGSAMPPPPPPTIAGKTFCPQCGTENATGARFCVKCGKEIRG